MTVGERVRTKVSLPGIPVGTLGTVREVGQLFLAVGFEDGRLAYYPRHQLGLHSEQPIEILPGECPLGLVDASVSPGSHLCLLPYTDREVVEAASLFACAGLSAGEACLCVGAPGWLAAVRDDLEGRAARLSNSLDLSRVLFLEPMGFYLPPADFTAARQVDFAASALAKDFPIGANRVRVFGHSPRYIALFDPEEWWEWERRATVLLREFGVTTVCAYDSAAVSTACWRQAHDCHPLVLKQGQLVEGGLPL